MNGWRPSLASINLTGAISQLLNPISSPVSRTQSAPPPHVQALVGTTVGALGLPPQTLATLDRSANMECIVCREVAGEVWFSMNAPTSACNHLPQVCMDCLQQTILTSITTGAYITGILCPSPDCSQRLDYYDIQKWSSHETFERYDKLLLQDSLRTDGHYVLCLEPSCAAGQEHTGGEHNNIVTCHVCGTKQCFRHQVLWHEGFTCAQWDEHQNVTVAQQEMSDEWILANTKPCPLCRRRLEKNEGCDHFTCRPPGGCGHQFCWECLAPWGPIISGDNSRHYDHCRYYDGPPGGNPASPEIRVASNPGRQQQPILNLFHPALHPFGPRPINVQQHPREFNAARAALTRLPPVANREAEARRVALRRNRGARVIEEFMDRPGQGRNGGPVPNGNGIELLDDMFGNLNLDRAGPREAPALYTRLEMPRDPNADPLRGRNVTAPWNTPRAPNPPFRDRRAGSDTEPQNRNLGPGGGLPPPYQRGGIRNDPQAYPDRPFTYDAPQGVSQASSARNIQPAATGPVTRSRARQNNAENPAPEAVVTWLENTRGALPPGAARPRANQPSGTFFTFAQLNSGPPRTSGPAGSSAPRRNASP